MVWRWEGDKGGQAWSPGPTAVGQGRAPGPPSRPPSLPGAQQPLEHGASPGRMRNAESPRGSLSGSESHRPQRARAPRRLRATAQWLTISQLPARP